MIEEFYKRKLIRDFLSLFSENKWKELLFLLVEYAIIQLKRNYNVGSLSLDDIITILDDLKEEDSRKFRQNMKALENNRLNESTGNKNTLENSSKANSDWRKGIQKVIIQKPRRDASSSKNKKSKNTNNLYPDWWAEEAALRQSRKNLVS
jgi:hypothetical protein